MKFFWGLLLFTTLAALGSCQRHNQPDEPDEPDEPVDLPKCPVELQSYNYPDYYVAVNGSDVYIRRLVNPQKWIITKGICHIPNTVSIRSVYYPNRYLRHQGWRLYEHPFVNNDLYRKDACFYVRKDKWLRGYYAFESVNFEGRYLRHQGSRMMLHQYQANVQFEKDASYRLVEPICLTFKSYNYPTYAYGLTGQRLYLKTNSPNRWILMHPGLSGHAQTVSFRSCHDATKYLRHSNYQLWEHPYSPSLSYRMDASYTVHPDKWYDGYDAYESVNYPHYYIRHENYRLNISSYDGSALYKKDASFQVYP